MAFIFFAEHAAREAQEDRLEGGALARELARGDVVALRERVERAQRVPGARPEAMGAVEGHEFADRPQVGEQEVALRRRGEADLLVEGKLPEEPVDRAEGEDPPVVYDADPRAEAGRLLHVVR
jgi:hypothetical protein